MDIARNAALVVVDVQQGFEEAGYWGTRNHPGADDNIAALLDAWQSAGRPVVFVRHDSVSPGSPLRPGSEGNGFKEYVERRRGKGGGAELLVTKTVNRSEEHTSELQ